MPLKNIAQRKIIVNNVVFCNSLLSKAKGLMFSGKLEDRCLVMVFDREQFIPLHMLFVFFPIDILFIGKDKKVVELFSHANPFRSHITPTHKAMYVVELPADTIRKHKLKLGQRLGF